MITPKIAQQAYPGQFADIRLSDNFEPLLRRPFSIHKVMGKGRRPWAIEILYEVVGKGSAVLSRKKAGEYLDVIGPLGNGFDCNSQFAKSHLAILVAGGMGVAPLVFLAEKLTERKTRKQTKRKTIVLIGAKTKKMLICEKEFKNLGCEVKISTDDGSSGFKGTVTELLKYQQSTVNSELLTIYACGPRPMLKEISRISAAYNIPAEISLEEHMACGIGACLGCVVNTKSGFKRVCKEGPVFDADEIIWQWKGEQ